FSPVSLIDSPFVASITQISEPRRYRGTPDLVKAAGFPPVAAARFGCISAAAIQRPSGARSMGSPGTKGRRSEEAGRTGDWRWAEAGATPAERPHATKQAIARSRIVDATIVLPILSETFVLRVSTRGATIERPRLAWSHPRWHE